eukprot:2768177-Heterocapsa_arctica.AAC.1
MQGSESLQLHDAATRALARSIARPAGIAGRHDLVGHGVHVDAQAHDHVDRALDVAENSLKISPMTLTRRLHMPGELLHRKGQ